MNIEELREYCISKPATSEEFPFDENTLVFKVMGKIFALTSLSNPELRVNLKCEPGKAERLREMYPCVLPGYHMHKKHWNTVIIDGSVPDLLIREWIDHSYDEVVARLPKKYRDTLVK